MREDWIKILYKDAVYKISTSKQKLKQKEYLKKGKFSIVDQGQDLIGGYTNDETKLLDCDLPVIVFGDHTKNIKLINFQFAPGADGTKVLEPSKYIIPEYISHLTQILIFKIKDKGYARHYQHIEKEFLPLAPLPIQRAIVSKIESLFSDLDNGIANLKKAQEQLKIYRQAVLMKAVTGELTEKFRTENPQIDNSEIVFQKIQRELDNAYDIACKKAKEENKRKPKDQRKNKKANNVTSILPEIPLMWSYYRLEDITYLVTDGTHFTPKYKDEGVKFLSVKNVRPFFIRDEKIKYISTDEHNELINRCRPENNDILYTKVGATYGYACKINLNYEFSIFVSLCLIKPVYKYFNSDFLELLMNSELIFRQARQRVSGSAVPDLHLIEIRDFKVPLPSIQEQHQIVQEIETRLSVCDKVEQNISESLEKAKALRHSILKKVFEGKLLSEAEIEACKQEKDYEPASVLLEKIKAEKLAKEQGAKKTKKKSRK